jgi:hypothetical protein
MQLPVVRLRRVSQQDQMSVRHQTLRRIRRLQGPLRRGTPLLRESLFRSRK